MALNKDETVKLMVIADKFNKEDLSTLLVGVLLAVHRGNHHEVARILNEELKK